MRAYTISRSGISPVPDQDIMTIIAPANKMIRIKRVRISGEDTASAAQETGIQRSTGGSGGGGALTAEKANTSDAAASSTINTTWSSQPSVSGSPHYVESWNSFGGGFDLTLDGREIYLVNSEQLSIRNLIGSSGSAPTLSITVELEEL